MQFRGAIFAASLVASGFCSMLTGCASSPRPSSTDFAASSRYNNELHDLFYEAWEQPRAVDLSVRHISVPVEVKIDGTGSVVDFRILKPTPNGRINASIADVGRRIKRVPPPPSRGSDSPIFRLRIFFELDIESG